LAKFLPLNFTALKTYAPAPDVAYGHPLLGVGRRGKYLVLDFEPASFVVHLMQGGRLLVDQKQAAKPRNGQARWKFADGRALLLTEAGTERRAGVWVVGGTPEERLAGEPFDHLGPEALDLDVDRLGALLADNNMRLHGWLRDQRIVAGLGRRLANEICHRAKLSPFASTGKLEDDAVGRLHTAIRECVEESLAYERTRSDMSSSKDRPGMVHHREGEPCPVCGDTIRAVEYRSYTVNYCPTCQTGGKVLADNTTSKFLK
ncbi:MAG TPA: DNA-formamidopyrimidine glycosylase family protein, partial [Acidimicrobiales bacterium]